MRLHQQAILTAVLTFLPLWAAGDDWPRWRGPHDAGSAGSGSCPVKFSDSAGLVWKAPLPGKGCSTPIVVGRRIYLTAPVDGRDAVLALDWDGRPLWQLAFGAERKGKHRNGSGANSSPASDGRAVFAYFKSGTLAAVDLAGKLRWKTNLQERFGKDTIWWDIGTSPVLTAADVVVAVMQEGDSYLAAFDKATGRLHWKVARKYSTPLEGDHSYTTPIVFGQGDGESLLVWGACQLTAHATADGRVLWSCGDFNPEGRKNWVAVASPVIAGNVAVVPYGRGACLHGVKLGGRGDVTATHRLWRRDDAGSFVPTPAVAEGRLYLLGDKGHLECIDPATGKTLSQGDLPASRSKYYASPLAADGKIYAAREDGVVMVARAGTFELLAENPMNDRLVASPVAVDGRLLLRGEKYLYCAGSGGKDR